jgi:SAM-dependent methyltransferase
MSFGSPGADVGELDRLRREYEMSLSWRLTRPVRAVGHLGRTLRPRRPVDSASQPPPQDRLDCWLEHFYGERLAVIDAACAQGDRAEQYALFRDLDDDLWAMLLTQQYQLYPHIRALLPSMPEPGLQELWNGRSGMALASQSNSFYGKLRRCYERHAERPLSRACVLDFGCGWGRLTRYLARDVAPGRLYGCDPVEGILDVCRANRVAATVARSEFLPERLPFDERFDLAFAFSVFTHLSEAAHEQCLLALHRSMQPGGILIVTIRPPAYLEYCEPMRPLLHARGTDERVSLAGPRFLFVPHPAAPAHPQSRGDGAIDYGETVITLPYLRERWSPLFELLEVNLLLDDPHQVMVTMRCT